MTDERLPADILARLAEVLAGKGELDLPKMLTLLAGGKQGSPEIIKMALEATEHIGVPARNALHAILCDTKSPIHKAAKAAAAKGLIPGAGSLSPLLVEKYGLSPAGGMVIAALGIKLFGDKTALSLCESLVADEPQNAETSTPASTAAEPASTSLKPVPTPKKPKKETAAKPKKDSESKPAAKPKKETTTKPKKDAKDTETKPAAKPKKDTGATAKKPATKPKKDSADKPAAKPKKTSKDSAEKPAAKPKKPKKTTESTAKAKKPAAKKPKKSGS